MQILKIGIIIASVLFGCMLIYTESDAINESVDYHDDINGSFDYNDDSNESFDYDDDSNENFDYDDVINGTCQRETPEKLFPPSVPHKTLTTGFLDQFNEIIVIGDQHGCYDELQLLINRFQLNDTVLKIFTGDITRKGPKNLEVIRFVKSCQTCISVRGNNDEKTLLIMWGKENIANFTFAPLDQWMEGLTQEEMDWMKDLPYSLYLPSLNARVCHAGFLPGGVSIEDNRPFTIMNIRTVIADPTCPGGWRPIRGEFLNSSGLTSFPWASQWRGPEHIYFGHDHKRQLQLYPFATGVDTSCVRGHYMTGIFLKGPRTGTFATQPALQIYHSTKV